MSDNKEAVLSLDETDINITIVTTQDGKEFVLPKSCTGLSDLLKAALEDSNCSKIPISFFTGNEMKYVIEYLKIHKGDDKGINCMKFKRPQISRCYYKNFETDIPDDLKVEVNTADIDDPSDDEADTKIDETKKDEVKKEPKPEKIRIPADAVLAEKIYNDGQIYNITNLANQMGIKPLLHLCMSVLSCKMRRCDFDKIKQITDKQAKSAVPLKELAKHTFENQKYSSFPNNTEEEKVC